MRSLNCLIASALITSTKGHRDSLFLQETSTDVLLLLTLAVLPRARVLLESGVRKGSIQLITPEVTTVCVAQETVTMTGTHHRVIVSARLCLTADVTGVTMLHRLGRVVAGARQRCVPNLRVFAIRHFGEEDGVLALRVKILRLRGVRLAVGVLAGAGDVPGRQVVVLAVLRLEKFAIDFGSGKVVLGRLMLLGILDRVVNGGADGVLAQTRVSV